MNAYRRRRAVGQRRHLAPPPKPPERFEVECVTLVGPQGSHQPIASLPRRRWRWLLYLFLAWGDTSPRARRLHDWLARKLLGLQMQDRVGQ